MIVIIIIIIINRICITLFSAVEHAHCADVSCSSECLTVYFYSAFFFFFFSPFNIYRSGVLTALIGCCMARPAWNCCHLGARSVYTVQSSNSLQCHLIQSHIDRVQVCLAGTCQLHCWQRRQGSCTCYCGNTGWNGHWNQSQQRRLTLEKTTLLTLLSGLKPGSSPSPFWWYFTV